METCSKCDVNERSISSNSYCSACVKIVNQSYRSNHKEEIAEKQRQYFQTNKAAIKIRRSTYDKNWNWKRYGIINKDGSAFTTVDFDRAYQVQQGKCLGCTVHQSELRQVLHPDHDHSTGFFRGLLCEHCNRALGLLRDDVNTLINLVDYLNKSKEQL